MNSALNVVCLNFKSRNRKRDLTLNIVANLLLGALVAWMETQFAGYVTWVQFALNNGLLSFGFGLLMWTDAMLKKTRYHRQLWFLIALVLTAYNFLSRTISSFPNEQISLTALAGITDAAQSTLAGAVGLEGTITVQVARRTLDYTMLTLMVSYLMTVAYDPESMCFLRVFKGRRLRLLLP